jgi:negative regulator of replication initiation
MTVRTTISMPDDLWEQIERQQKDTGASTSEIVRRALVAFFPAPTKTNGRKATKTVTKAPARKRVVRK